MTARPALQNILGTPLGDPGNHWCWRQYMAESIAEALDLEEMGVKGLYLFGSVDRGDCGPGSDIDLLVHFDGSGEQQDRLLAWLDGWSRALARMNLLRTGYDAGEGLLDVHLVTDRDLWQVTAFAALIRSAREPVSLLRRR